MFDAFRNACFHDVCLFVDACFSFYLPPQAKQAAKAKAEEEEQLKKLKELRYFTEANNPSIFVRKLTKPSERRRITNAYVGHSKTKTKKIRIQQLWCCCTTNALSQDLFAFPAETHTN